MTIKNYTLAILAAGAFLFGSFDAHAAKVGSAAPNFKALDTYSKPISLSQLKGKIVVLEWTNHECPFVVKHYESGNMQKIQKEVAGEDLVWITVVSSAPGKQGYVTGQDANRITFDNKSKITHKILDATGEIGRLYDAKTTPHMYVIDAAGDLAYAGAIDDHKTWRKRGLDDAENYVLAAVNDLRAGQDVQVSETAPYGCSVKY